MTVGETVDGVLADLLGAANAERVVDPERAARFVQFGAVGLSGAVLNTAVFTAGIGLLGVHYLAAGLLAFVVAVTWNFAFNWFITFNRPQGRLDRQYMQFVAVSLGGFLLYLGTLAAAIDGGGVHPLAANVLAILVSGAFNFIGADEFAFEADVSLGAKASVSVNRAVHMSYRGRRKAWLQGTPLYHGLFKSYCLLLGWLAGPTHTVEAGGERADFELASGPEVASVLHTVRKEQMVLNRFVDDVREDDVVWDVGANLGVYACLAGQRAERVAAVEPFGPTAQRISANARRSGCREAVSVHEFALVGPDQSGPVDLGLERAEVGTQTPGVTAAKPASTTPVRGVQGLWAAVDGILPGPPDVIKIDVEGAEPAVLEGLGPVLTSTRVVYVETHSPSAEQAVVDQLEASGHNVEIIHQYDREMHFRAARAEGVDR